MRKRITSLLLVFVLLLGMMPATLAASPGSSRESDLSSKELFDGLSYGEEIIQNTDKEDVRTFVVTVDGSDDSLKIVTGVPNDETPLKEGLTQTTSGQALAAQRNGKNVLAAVNADFFNINDATLIQPESVTIKDGELLSPYYEGDNRNRSYFFGIKSDGEAVIGDKEIFDTVADSLDQAVGGGPWLVKDGQVQNVEDARHPRTAVGIKEDGSILLVVADGRSNISAGLTFEELAQYMKDLGAVEALNLDGGGSSAAVVKNPDTYALEVKNVPSDGKERPVGNTLLVIDTDSTSAGVDLTQDTDGYYLIEEAADFNEINKLPNGNYRLSRDLDLNGSGISTVSVFSGDFDGDDHTISGLSVESGGSYALFTTLDSTGSIHDLKMEDVDITASGSAAALVGSCAGRVEDVTVTGSLTGAKPVGGIVGYLDNGGQLLRSSAGVSVSGTERMGGLVGECTDNSLIDSCYVNARVLGGNMAAGLVGRAVSDVTKNAKIRNCIVTGSVQGAMEPGGIGGLLKIGVANCIVRDMSINATGTGAVSSGNVTGLLGAWINGQQPYTGNVIQSGSIVATAQCTAHRIGYQPDNKSQNYVNPAVTINGMPETGGSHDNNIGADATAEQLASRDFYDGLGFDFDTVFNWDDVAKTPVLKGVDQSVKAPGADGTALERDSDGYYLIKTTADLGEINKAPLEKYRLNGDLDFTGTKAVSVTTFGGEFDGAGHTVSNLAAAPASGSYALFSTLLSGGSIHDLKLSDVDIRTSADYTAALVGSCAGTVEDITITGKIYGGGITGAVAGSLSNGGVIRRCAAGAMVVGIGNQVGGIAGFNDGIIEACYANVTVQGVNNVGGIAGYSDKNDATRAVRNCIAEGAVTSTGIEAGGIGGLLKMPTANNIVKNMTVIAANATTAAGNGNVAGLLGGWMKYQPNAAGNVILSGTVQTAGVGEGYRLCYNAGTGTFTNNYVNPAVTVNGKTVSGGTASDGQGGDMTAEQMASKDFYAGLGFDFNEVFDWNDTAKTPVLKNVDQTVTAPAAGPAPGEADVKNVALTIGADETQRRLSWYTDSVKTGEVQLALASDMTNGAFPAQHTSFASSSKASCLAGYYSNQAVITGLTADTKYAYRVGNSDGWSEVYTFTTGSSDRGSVSFLFAGDPQIGSSGNVSSDTTGWTTSLNQAVKELGGADFLISAGNQVDRFDNETQYASFLKPEALRSLTLATNIGNHDSKGINYQEHFNLPNESSSQGDTPAGGDYWYSYNGVLFLSLNSNNMSTAEHKEFMSSAIRAYQAANNGAEPLWKIVTFHHSIYSTASHMEDGDIIQRRNGLPQVFKELDIDVVLQGHDHVYTRTYMMDGGAVSANENYTYASGEEKAPTAVTAPSGILYVTANSASGSKYYDLHAGYNYNWAAVRDQGKKPSISKATVSENTFTITTYNVNDMSVLDTFTINKTAQQTEEPAKLLIDQVYGDGGKGETPIANSFIELYNPTDEAVSLDGYTLSYGDKSLDLTGGKSIPAKSSYLIMGASAGTTAEYQTYNLPEADQTCDWQINNKNYTITLKKGGTVLDSVTADENVDAIKVSKQKTLQRVDHADTDTNEDFRIVVWEKGKMTATADTLAQYAPHNSKGEYGSLVAAEPETPVYTPVKTSDTRVKGYYDATGSLKLELAGRYNSGAMAADGGSLEIVQYNPVNGYAYAVSGVKGKLIAVNLNDSLDGNKVVALSGTEYDLSKETFDIADFTYGDMTSVAISPDGSKLAVAIQAENYAANGVVAIFTCKTDGSLELNGTYTVGVQPDMVTFADNDTILTADEGEPRKGTSGTDPKGSVSIVKIGGTVNTVTFDHLDAQREELTKSGVLIQKNSNPSTDFEPEYIAVSGTTAYVALQEANAIAVLNIEKGEFTGVYPLGLQDYSKTKVDLQKNGTVELSNYKNIYGIKMPDGISVVTIGGKDYLLTANEGDSRADWAGMDNEYAGKTSPTGNVTLSEEVVWFDATKWDGLDTDKAYVFGGRSFSIYEVTANGLIWTYDSGSDFEEITAEKLGDYFNCSNDKIKLDNRSGKKGPEPESVVTGTVKNKTYAFIALERIGGVMVYDITVPANAKFVNYINSREFDADIQGDVSPEGLCFVSAADSKTGIPLLLAACEVSGTMTVVQVETASSGGTSGGSSSGSTSNSSQYTIRAEAGQGGTISPNGSIRVERGGDQTFTVKAGSGYELKDVLVDGKSVGAVSRYTFENVRAAHTIKAVFRAVEETAENPFMDVAENAWYKAAVDYVHSAGLMNGISNAAFGPDITTTRGMIVTILYRMENPPAVSGVAGFIDVAADQYYTDAVAWASANGIVGGYGNGTFGPNDPITREQLVTMLWRYAGSPESSYALDSFQDQGEVSGYAATAMAWAVEHGIVSGTSATTLSPADISTRAQLAAILMRFCADQTDI